MENVEGKKWVDPQTPVIKTWVDQKKLSFPPQNVKEVPVTVYSDVTVGVIDTLGSYGVPS